MRRNLVEPALLISRSGSSGVGNSDLAGFFASATGLAFAPACCAVRATRDLLRVSGSVALLDAVRRRWTDD